MTAPTERTPDFVVIGAAKAGTTSLHRYLDAHPDIFMSTPLKEPRLFLGFDAARSYWAAKRGLAIGSTRELLSAYMLSGYAGERLFGESSADYTVGDLSVRHEVPRRIKAANPAMKLVYIVRNPFARIASNYLHLMRLGRGLPALAEIDFADAADGGIMAATSLYFRQIERYLEHFDEAQLHVLVLEELACGPRAVLSSLLAFLGVDDSRYPTSAFPIHNAAHNREEAGAAALRFSSRAFDFLQNRFRTDIAALERLLGRSIDCWDLSREEWVGGNA